MAKAVDRKKRPANIHGLALSNREICIAVNAYYLAEKRGFQPGRELDDWLEAEVGVDPVIDAGAVLGVTGAFLRAGPVVGS